MLSSTDEGVTTISHRQDSHDLPETLEHEAHVNITIGKHH